MPDGTSKTQVVYKPTCQPMLKNPRSDSEIIEFQLSHTTKNPLGMAYDRAQFIDERAEYDASMERLSGRSEKSGFFKSGLVSESDIIAGRRRRGNI